jgi:hypothetical protein
MKFVFHFVTAEHKYGFFHFTVVAVKLNASVVKGRFVSTPLTKAIFPILARTFIINNIINPIIYGFLDPTFLQHCEMTLRLMFCMKLKDSGVQK